MKNPNSRLNIYPKASMQHLVVQQLNNETLIYNLTTNRAFALNETASFVWNRCDGRTSISEITEQLSRKTKQPVEEEVIRLALKQLLEENLITESKQIISYFGGMTRREAIKRVGLASMVALPVISSIVAPTAAQAQSGTASGACTDNCVTIGVGCGCGAGTLTCAPGTTIGVTVGAGVCVAAAAAAALGINVSAGANGNVCLVAAACIL